MRKKCGMPRAVSYATLSQRNIQFERIMLTVEVILKIRTVVSDDLAGDVHLLLVNPEVLSPQIVKTLDFLGQPLRLICIPADLRAELRIHLQELLHVGHVRGLGFNRSWRQGQRVGGVPWDPW